MTTPHLSLVDQALRRVIASQVATPRIGRMLGSDARMASNDEEPVHVITRERSGWGPSDSVQVVCSCSWRGVKRFEYQDDMSAGLAADEQAHRNGGVL